MPVKKAFRHVAGIVAISLLPTLATAAGLGKINVLSALGQPLLAEIDLVAVTAEEFPSLAAKLASQDAYREANVEYPNGLGGFRFTIDKRAGGQPYLRVSTGQPVNEPFLDLLVELNWSAGRLLREYPVLLDPPGYAAAKPQAPSITPPQAAAPQAPAAAAVKPMPKANAAERPRSSAVAQDAESSPAVAQAGETAGTYGPVKSGETLRVIAESVKAPGMSLEQMLVALYRENKGAFLNRNMNRLKTGMILKVPAAAEIATVSPETARREVVAQTADWNAYRKRLAGVAERAPGRAEKTGQTAGGKVDTKISEEGAPPETGKDVLKLSKGQTEAAGTGKGGKASQEKFNAMQEELGARDRALDDARSRITELEKQIAEMRRLLELKGTPLPATTKPAEPTKSAKLPEPVVAEKPTAIVKPPVMPAEPKVVEPEVKPMPPVAVDKPPVTEDPAALEKPKKPKRIVPPPAPVEEPGFLAGLLENPLIPAGGAAVLGLLGLLGYRQFRKRKDAQLGAFTATAAVPMGGKGPLSPSPATLTPDAGNSSFLSDFDKIGAGNIDTDEVDPVAEADVYIAYGRDAQAEEILKEAMSKDGARYEIPLKLLEIYSNRKSVQSFETVAKQLHGSIGTQHPLWSKVAEMGRKIDADNPLYAGSGVRSTADRADNGAATVIRTVGGLGGAMAEAPKAEEVPSAMKDTMTLREPTLANSPLDLDLDFDAAPHQPGSNEGENLSSNTDAHTLDFDLGEAAGDAGSHANSQAHIDLDAAPSGHVKDPFVLDFDLDTPPPSPTPAVTASHQTTSAPPQPPNMELNSGSLVDLPPLDLSDIDLNLGMDSGSASGGSTGGSWQSAATKLDLARAYLEIGDKVGAVEILQEVIKEGSPEQQEEAKKLAAQA